MLDFTCTTRLPSLFRCMSQNVSEEARLRCSIWSVQPLMQVGLCLLLWLLSVSRSQSSRRNLKRSDIARPCHGYPIEGLKNISDGCVQSEVVAAMFSRMLSGHKSRPDDFVCTPRPVSQVIALQSYSILLVYSTITCAILTNRCTTHISLPNPLNIVSLTLPYRPP